MDYWSTVIPVSSSKGNPKVVSLDEALRIRTQDETHTNTLAAAGTRPHLRMLGP